MITYKFRIYPSKEQQSILWQHANRLNRLYNHFLDMKIKAYKENGENLSRFSLQNMLPEMKRNDDILKQIHSQVVQGANNSSSHRLDDVLIKECRIDPSSSGYLRIHSIIHQIIQIIIKS